MSVPSECSICANVRVLTPYHGEMHRFCAACISRLRISRAPCPICREEVYPTMESLPTPLCLANNQGWFSYRDDFPRVLDPVVLDNLSEYFNVGETSTMLNWWKQGVHHFQRLTRLLPNQSMENIQRLKVASSYFRVRLEDLLTRDRLHRSLSRPGGGMPPPTQGTLQSLYECLDVIVQMFYGVEAPTSGLETQLRNLFVEAPAAPISVVDQTYELLNRLVRDRAPAATIQAASNLYALVSRAGSI